MARRTKTEIMDGVDCVASKVVALNTVKYETKSGDQVIRLHNTDILRFGTDGSTTISTGGWKTPTTKDRINKFLPKGSVFSDRGTWILSLGNKKHAFADGMRIGARGGVSGAGNNKKEIALKKMIKLFCDKMRKMEILPSPNNGDCWFCCMRDTLTGKPIGDVSDSNHIFEHLKERYVHGSLIYNAMEWAGCSPFAIQMAFSENPDSSKNYRDLATRPVRRYLKRQLGLA